MKLTDGGRRRIQAFCSHCGTPLYADYPEANTPYITLRTGFLDQREQLVPRVQMWRRSALQWSDRIAEMPGLEKEDFASLRGVLQPNRLDVGDLN